MRRLARIATAAGIAAAAITFVPAAHAAPPSWSCDAPASQVFAPWKDKSFYQLVDGGTFDDGVDAWQLAGDATVVGDGAGDNELQLASGASAISPPICVTEDSESFRFFSSVVAAGRNDDNLQVDVLYLRRKAQGYKVKVRSADSSPVQKLKLAAGEFKKDSTVRLQFTALNGATVAIDDVYMDPRLH